MRIMLVMYGDPKGIKGQKVRQDLQGQKVRQDRQDRRGQKGI